MTDLLVLWCGVYMMLVGIRALWIHWAARDDRTAER